VRSCDLHAIGIHDRVLLGRTSKDAHYADARRGIFVVAVACSDPAGTCFCVSMGTGPRPERGFDLCLTEIETAEGRHRLLVQVGSERGAEVLAALPAEHAVAADEADRAAAGRVTETAAGRMGRHLDTRGIRDVLYAGVESPRWDDVASRCLACGNCTLVCPTCFCTSVDDETDLTGDVASRVRHWDSCFTGDFSYLHGGSVRATVRSRYRQWATHKLASWYDQFGTSGCVGCGRCIAWCPAAIDITEEAAAVRADPGPSRTDTKGG
jgi:ferredoxin